MTCISCAQYVQIVSAHLGTWLVVRNGIVVVKVHVMVLWCMAVCNLVGEYRHFCRCTLGYKNSDILIFFCGCYMIAQSGQNAGTHAKFMCKQHIQ